MAITMANTRVMEEIVGIITCLTGLIFFPSFLRYMYRELFVSICTRYEIGLSRMSKNRDA